MTQKAKRRIYHGSAKTLALLLSFGLILHWTRVIPAIPAGAIGATLAAIILLVYLGREAEKEPATSAKQEVVAALTNLKMEITASVEGLKQEFTGAMTALLTEAETERIRRELRFKDMLDDLADRITQVTIRQSHLSDQLSGLHETVITADRDQQAHYAQAFDRLGELGRALDLRTSTLARMIREQHADVAGIREEQARVRDESHVAHTEIARRIDAVGERLAEMDHKFMKALGGMWEWAREKIEALSKEHLVLDSAVRECLAIAGPHRRPPGRARRQRGRRLPDNVVPIEDARLLKAIDEKIRDDEP